MGCDALRFGLQVAMFWRNSLCMSLRFKMEAAGFSETLPYIQGGSNMTGTNCD